jgi:hypothetical protein
MSDPKLPSATTLLAGEEPYSNLKARHNIERYAGISTSAGYLDGPFLGFPYSQFDDSEGHMFTEELAMDQPGFLDGFDLFPVEYPTNSLELRLQQLTQDLKEYSHNRHNQARQSTVFPEAICASLLSAENLLKLVNLYFYRWHHQWPILHWPTFDVDVTSLPLLLAVALSGAAYSRDEDAVSEDPISAKIFYEIAEGYIYDRLEIVTSQTNTTAHMLPDEVIETCQAALLTEVLHKSVNDTRIRQRVFTKRHPALVATLRSLGILGTTHRSSIPTPSWDTFVKVELLVRLATWTFMSDTLPLLFCNQPPSIMLSEMTGNLPCDGTLWDAETEHDFDEALRQLPPIPERQVCVQQLVADLLDESEIGNQSNERELSPEHQYILIVGKSTTADLLPPI